MKYHLIRRTGERTRVCQIMWLATLGYRHSCQFADKIFHTFPYSAVVLPSQRGKSTPDAIVIDCESIRAHILRHNPSVSHHRRAHAPNVLYPPPELCVLLCGNTFSTPPTSPVDTPSTDVNAEISLIICQARQGGVHQMCYSRRFGKEGA